MNSSVFKRVGRDFACPICAHEDWCLRSQDASAAICQRVEEGSVRRIGEAGWLHRLKDDWHPSSYRQFVIKSAQERARRTDLEELAEVYRRSVKPGRLARLAGDLGVSSDSLARLGMGWSEESRAWSFPMTDVSGNVLGIRLRTEAGRKFSVRGGREGLFIPDGIDTAETLLVAEGATDTASLLDLGFEAVGRPSCRGGTGLIVELIARWCPKSVVIVADNDPRSQGLKGSRSLARRLALSHTNTRIIAPPESVKDVRCWVKTGADHEDVSRWIDRARSFEISVSVETFGSASAGEAVHVE